MVEDNKDGDTTAPDGNDEEPDESGQRPRGILTKSDRRLLWGDKELSDQGRRNARYRIRERIKNSLMDFVIINDKLRDEDRVQIFDDVIDEHGYSIEIVSLLQFIYTGKQEAKGELEFAKLLKFAIDNYEGRAYPESLSYVQVNIDITREELDTREIIERLLEGEGTFAEINHLMENNDLEQMISMMEDEGVDQINLVIDIEGEDESGQIPLEGMRTLLRISQGGDIEDLEGS